MWNAFNFLTYHLISVIPCSLRRAFVLLKCPQPRNPRWAERGEGWGASRTTCFCVSIRDFFFWAWLPQRRNMRNSRLSERVFMMESVKSSHHFPVCDMGCHARTVSVVFRRRTHCSAQRDRSPLWGIGVPISPCISLKIFMREGGFRTHSCTEKARPWACPGPW